MWPVSDRYLEAVRGSERFVTSATHRDLISGVSTTLDVVDGSVTVDASSNVRRTLDVSLPADEPTWQALDTVGGEITVTRAAVYADGARETVPLGVFVVDIDQIGYASGGTIAINGARDRWANVQTGLPPDQLGSVASNPAWAEIKRLVEGAWSAAYPFPGWAQLDTSATAKVGIQLWDDGDREAAILSICQANSLEVFFDAQGKAVLRPVKVLTTTSAPVWTVDAGVNGVMVSADRSRDRTRVYNAVEVSSGSPDIVFNTVVVKNTTASDPLNVNGPLKYKPLKYSDPSIRSSAQARAAGLTLLAKVTGAAQQLSLGSLNNDALDASDVIAAVLPKIDRNTPRPSEIHIIDTITNPLVLDGSSAMTIQTRSTIDANLGG